MVAGPGPSRGRSPTRPRTSARRATSSSRWSCAMARSSRSAIGSIATIPSSRSRSPRPTARCPATTSSRSRPTRAGRGRRRRSSRGARPSCWRSRRGPRSWRSGDIVATAGLFKMPDGTNPSGQFGPLLRSTDGGRTWDDRTRYFDSPDHSIAAYESHVCEMQPGRVVAICWAFDLAAGRYLHNQVTVSHDDGHTWSAPIDTGIQAESSNLLYLGGERLLSIHCHRGSEVGLYVRLVDFSGDRWQVLEETADLGRFDRAADARRPVVLRVRGLDPLRPGVRCCVCVTATSWRRTGASSTGRARC